MKPFKLRRWRWKVGDSDRYFFFTCARPGRTSKDESKLARVSDSGVGTWLSSLPGPDTAIVSLLGRKPKGASEYAFYSFYGGYDNPEEHLGRKSFREWLDEFHRISPILLREHPTIDFQRMSDGQLEATAKSISELLSQGRTVVLMDSGGEQRTGQVCRYMGAVEDSSSNT